MYKLLEDRHGIIGNKGWKERKVGDVRNFCRDNPRQVIVAVEGDEIAGYATFGLDRDDRVGSVFNNAVDPVCRGRGIATVMIDWILDKFRREGMNVARLVVFVHNHPARKVYEKLGFKEIAGSVHYTLDLEDGLRKSGKG